MNKIAEKGSFRKGVAGFSLATAISRVSGLAREIVMAHLFGAGGNAARDAFEVAFRIPNLLRDFFAENSLSASFVPVFVEKMKTDDRSELWKLANNLFNTLLVVVGALVVIGVVFSPQIVSVIGYGFKSVPGKVDLTVILNRILFPFLIFISLSAWSGGILNAHNRFFVPAVSSALFNIGSIVLAYLTYSWWMNLGPNPGQVNYSIIGMAVGGIVGVLAQFLLNYIFVLLQGYRYRPYLDWRSPDLWRVLKLWGPVVIGLGMVEIQATINTALAALLEQGSVSWLAYSYRIMHLPLGIFGAAVGTVSLTLFSRQRAEGDIAGLVVSLKGSLRTVSVLLIPIIAFFMAFVEPIVRLIYERGAFSALDTSYTAQALFFYMIGIWAASSVRTLSGAFYAFRDARTPMFVNLGSVLLNVGLNLLVAFVFFKERQFRAFPIATSFCAFFSMSLLMVFLKRKLSTWRIWDHPLYALRILAAAALSLAPVYLGYRFYLLPHIHGLLGTTYPWLKGFFGNLLLLALLFGVFALLYFVLTQLFGVKELKRILRKGL